MLPERTVDVVLFFHTLFSCAAWTGESSCICWWFFVCFQVGYVTMIGDFCIKSASGLLPGSVFARRRESSILAWALEKHL